MLFAGSRRRALCCWGTHCSFLPVGNRGGEEMQLNIKKPVEVSGRSAGHGLVSSPCRTPPEKKQGDTSPFLRVMEPVQVGGVCVSCLLAGGARRERDSRAGTQQWGRKYPTSTLRSYCGRGKHTAVPVGDGKEKPFFRC